MAKSSKNTGLTTAQNSFEGGLVADLHVMASPSNTVRAALNMELVTIGDDQYIYQNIRGSSTRVEWTIGPDYIHEGSEYSFTPLGLEVHNDIAYILSGAFKEDGTFLAGTIGTFPSPDWDKLNGAEGKSYLRDEYSALHNFRAADENPYIDPFVTTRFNFQKNRHIDIEIQGDFDGSVNIIFTDNLNNPGIINSRFKRLENNRLAYLADRANNNDSNTYSYDDWDRVALIQNTNYPVKVTDMRVEAGGYLRGGGYRYYFKYATQEGNTTEVLYESPLIPISNGNLGLTKDQISDKKVIFKLEDLDNSYSGIKVYFAHFDGETQATTDIFAISALYTFNTTLLNEVTIAHTGLEAIESVDSSEINASFTPLDTVRTSTIINDRLALAGVTSTLDASDIEALEKAAKRVTLWERREDVTKDYSDPLTAANKLGYWKGESYEFAIVFMLTNKGLSPAFPVTGMDNIYGEQSNPHFGDVYPEVELNSEGFSEDGLVFNDKGLFRTARSGLIYTPSSDGIGRRHITYIEADARNIDEGGAISNIVSGFFVVRRERIKNVLMQGMMVPTLKVPSKPPTIATYVDGDQQAMDAAKRYLMPYFAADNPTIGLNAPYNTVLSNTGYNTCKVDFPVVFVPQASQLLNVITFEKSWIVNGGIGQEIDGEKYQKTIERNGDVTKKMHMAFMSAELDINLVNIQSSLNGVSPSIEVQTAAETYYNYGASSVRRSPMAATQAPRYENPVEFNTKSPDTYHLYQVEPISYKSPEDWVSIAATNVTATVLESGRAVFSKGAFTAKVDRSIGYYGYTDDVDSEADDTIGDAKFGAPFYKTETNNSREYSIGGTVISNVSKFYNPLGSSARRAETAEGKIDKDQHFYAYSLMSQSYSTYLGIEVDVIDSDTNEEIELPEFHFKHYLEANPSAMVPPLNSYIYPEAIEEGIEFVNTGHLADIYRSSTGRWRSDELPILYRYDSGDPYFTVSDRVGISEAATVAIYRGDCFITKLTKKVAYKNGVEEAKSASPADAGTYGIGLTGRLRHKGTDAKDLADDIRYDKGRNLYDVGHTVEIFAQTNINADIRSIQNLSDEDTLLYGGERDFYPNKKEIFGDARPDAASYNHGYTGDQHVITYNRIEENSPVYNTSFPNRILLSERNQTQSFFNSFRDIKGFNFRDYGVELGPIIKIIAVRNILLSVHPGGVLAIGVDDKTLIAEGSDVYVDTAQALSPTSKTISDAYGATNPEAVVKTDITVAGVDYNASAVWLFEGNKLSIISEFAVKTILEKYKAKINELGGTARVYSSFNFAKHALGITYVSENSTTGKQTHVGTVVYNTALQRWSSEVSEGSKFSMSIGASTYTTGFQQADGLVNKIWEEDSLVNTDGKDIRNNFRGIQYEYEFEITINSQPSVEKILDNLLVITNKVLPTKLIYTTSNDNNDAAVNIWGQEPGESEVTQEIFTRNNTGRKGSRLGILKENAYYKNSDLYISVNKRGSMSKKTDGTKRIRDKHIKIKFVYSGSDETFLQAIISMLSISYS